jgi:hypothetical protein
MTSALFIFIAAGLAVSFFLSGMEAGVVAVSRVRHRRVMRAGHSTARRVHRYPQLLPLWHRRMHDVSQKTASGPQSLVHLVNSKDDGSISLRTSVVTSYRTVFPSEPAFLITMFATLGQLLPFVPLASQAQQMLLWSFIDAMACVTASLDPSAPTTPDDHVQFAQLQDEMLAGFGAYLQQAQAKGD